MRHLLALLVVAIVLAIVHTARAAPNKVQTVHWSPEAHLRLSQCFIAESDEASDDWTAIAYTIKNWLGYRQRRWPLLRFIDVVKGVCSVHRMAAGRRSTRQRWIRRLSFPISVQPFVYEKPRGFPRSSSWERKQRYWTKALRHAARWRNGKLSNPCRGRAISWGAPRDPNNKWHLRSDDPIIRGRPVVRLRCSDRLSNDYYRLMTRREKQAAVGT